MDEKQEKPNFWEIFNRLRIAYQYYIAFMLSVPTFLAIIYEKYIEPSILSKLIPTQFTFIIAFFVVGIPSLWVLSLYHYEIKENRPKYEMAKLDMAVNPWNRSIAQAIMYLAEDEKEKAKEVLKEWV